MSPKISAVFEAYSFADTRKISASVSSCKRSCYQCTQYCAYCVEKRDTSVAFKVCADKLSGDIKVDSFMRTLEDTNHICNLLSNQTDVCDGKNAINDAVSYYKKQDYYCNPKQ